MTRGNSDNSSMNKGTLLMVAFAALLLIGALWMAPRAGSVPIFEDTGEPLFREFNDPSVATSLEVLRWNESAANVTRFKVELKEGRWLIPSHHDYPADGTERMGKAAASFIDVKRDIYYGDKPDEHKRFGLLDPEGAEGNGDEKATRFTMRDASGKALIDVLVGSPVPNKGGYHHVRLPESKRVYGVRLELDVSTNFTDWIDNDLLRIDQEDVVTMIYDPYRVDEKQGRVADSKPIHVVQSDDSDAKAKWKLDGTAPKGKKLNDSNVAQMASAIDKLEIVGVRPQPKQLTLAALQSKGFFVTSDGKKLYGNEGELRAVTADGILYTLYFGEITFDAGLALTSGKSQTTSPAAVESETGAADEADKSDNSTANRYLFVNVGYDPALDRNALADALPTPEPSDDNPKVVNPGPAAVDTEKQGAHAKRASALQERFAPWFYVISDASFKTIHKERADLFLDE